MHAPRRLPILGLALTLSLACACAPQDKPSKAGARPQAPGPRQVIGDQRTMRVELSLDSAEITTAQRLTMTITTSLAEGWSAAPVDIAPALPENWKIAEDHSAPAETGGDSSRSTIRRTVVIEPFLAGEFSLGALEFTANSTANPGHELAIIRGEPMIVRVRSVLADESDQSLASAKSVVDPPARTRWRLWAAVAAAVLALVWFLRWRIRVRRGRTPEPARAPAHEIALRRLDSLVASSLLDRGAFKEFYFAASHILRRYIEDRFGLRAPRWTTEELLDAARVSLALAGEDVRAIERFSRACDEVKFAAALATRPQAEEVALAVRDFIERTRSDTALIVDEPVSIPPEQGGAAHES